MAPLNWLLLAFQLIMRKKIIYFWLLESVSHVDPVQGSVDDGAEALVDEDVALSGTVLLRGTVLLAKLQHVNPIPKMSNIAPIFFHFSLPV